MAELAELVEAELQATLKRYRASPEQVREALLASFAEDRALEVQLHLPLERLRRTRACREAVDRARKRLYAELRRYLPDKQELDAHIANLEAAGTVEAARRVVLGHASTRERLDEPFVDRLLGWVEPGFTVLDVGAGMFPLLFPSGRNPYLALDREPRCVRAIEAWARVSPGLAATRWELSEGWGSVGGPFDVALLLKIVPVVARQERDLLFVLAAVPARRLVVSGSRSALVRHEDIERRERNAIRRFLRLVGRPILGEFSTDSEFALVL